MSTGNGDAPANGNKAEPGVAPLDVERFRREHATGMRGESRSRSQEMAEDRSKHRQDQEGYQDSNSRSRGYPDYQQPGTASQLPQTAPLEHVVFTAPPNYAPPPPGATYASYPPPPASFHHQHPPPHSVSSPATAFGLPPGYLPTAVNAANTFPSETISPPYTQPPPYFVAPPVAPSVAPAVAPLTLPDPNQSISASQYQQQVIALQNQQLASSQYSRGSSNQDSYQPQARYARLDQLGQSKLRNIGWKGLTAPGSDPLQGPHQSHVHTGHQQIMKLDEKNARPIKNGLKATQETLGFGHDRIPLDPGTGEVDQKAARAREVMERDKGRARYRQMELERVKKGIPLPPNLENADAMDDGSIADKTGSDGMDDRQLNQHITELKRNEDIEGACKLWPNLKTRKDLNHIHLSNFVGIFALSKGQERENPVHKEIFEFAMDKFTDNPYWFDVRSIASLCHSLGKARHKQGKHLMFFKGIVQQRDRIVKEGEPLDIFYVAWACARLEYLDFDLLTSISGEWEKLAKHGDVSHIVMTLWAMASMRFIPFNLLDAVERQSETIANRGKVQEIAMAVWSFARLKRKSTKLFSAISAEKDRLVASDNVQSMANVLWAFAENGYKDSELFYLINTKADLISEKGTAKILCNVVWAMAKNGYEGAEVFAAVEKNLDKVLEEGDYSGVVNMVWAFAKNGHFKKNVFEKTAASKCATKLITNSKSDEIAKILWAYSSSDHLVEGGEMLVKLWTRCCEEFYNFTVESLSQVFDFYVWTQVNFKSGTLPVSIQLRAPNEQFMNLMIKSCNSDEFGKPTGEFEKSISSVLTEMDIEHEAMKSPWLDLVDQGCYGHSYMSIDIVTAAEKRKVAVEFNGPESYVERITYDDYSSKKGRNFEVLPNGFRKYKEVLLNKLGWYVININYVEMFEKRNKLDDRMFYINSLLRAAHQPLMKLGKLVKTSYFIKFNKWKKLTKPF